MSTQHEVGQVPSVTPTPAAFGGPALIMSIIGIVLLSLIGAPVGLIVGIVLLFVNKRRYRMIGIIGTALSAVVMVIAIIFSAVILSAISNSIVASVTTTAPNSTVVDPAAPTATGSSSPTLEAIMKERTDSRATLCRTVPGVVTTASTNITEGAAFDAWYKTMRQAGLRHDPSVLACAILHLSPSEIPDARPRYQKLFQTYQTLDAAHQLKGFGLADKSAALKVNLTQTDSETITMIFADGSSKTEDITLIYVDGVWFWNNFVM